MGHSLTEVSNETHPATSFCMSTRSGVTYKAMSEEQHTHAEGPPAEGPTTTGNTLPELSGLTEMVRVMIEDRERREQEIALERERRDREIAEERNRMERQREEERQEMHRQMERLQQLFTEHTVAAATRPRNDIEPVKLTRLTRTSQHLSGSWRRTK